MLVVPRTDHSVALLREDGEADIVAISLAADSRTCAAVTNAGDRLAVGSADGTIELLDIRSDRLISSWNAHAKQVYCLQFSIDGQTLVSYGRDHEIKTWGASAGTLISAVQIDVTERQHQDLSPAADLLVVGERYGKISVWDCGTGTSLLEVFDTGSKVPKVAFSPPGGEFVVAVNQRGSAGERSRIMIYRTNSSEPRLEWTTPKLEELSFSNDGSLLATTTNVGDVTSIDVWNVDAQSGIELISPETTEKAQSIAWLQDDDQLLCGTSEGSLNIVTTGRSLTRNLFEYFAAIEQVAATESGRLAAVVGADVHMLTVNDRDPMTQFVISTPGVCQVASSVVQHSRQMARWSRLDHAAASSTSGRCGRNRYMYNLLRPTRLERLLFLLTVRSLPLLVATAISLFGM